MRLERGADGSENLIERVRWSFLLSPGHWVSVATQSIHKGVFYLWGSQHVKPYKPNIHM